MVHRKSVAILNTTPRLLAALRAISVPDAQKILEQNFGSLGGWPEAVSREPCLYTILRGLVRTLPLFARMIAM